MNKTNIRKDLEDYINWCKSQGTGFDPSQYSVFAFYMQHIYNYNKGEKYE